MVSLAHSHRRDRKGNRRRAVRSKFPQLPLGLEPLEARQLLNAGPSTPTPEAAQFVTSLYDDLLQRAPSAQEVAGWVSAIDSGTSITDVVHRFTASPEFQGNLITNDYQTLLGRMPASWEASVWLSQMQAGLDERQIEAGCLASREYYANHGGTNTGWLNGLYSDLLNRAADPGSLATWNQQLQQGVSRQTIALNVLDSKEVSTRIVAAAYQQLLGRAPDPVGAQTFVTALTGGMTPSQLDNKLASSAEYFTGSTHWINASSLQSYWAAPAILAPSTSVPSTSGQPSVSSYAFDFGPRGSAAAPGFLKAPLQAYTPALGYGWQSLVGLGWTDRGVGASATEDFVFGTRGVFLVDLPAGIYSVKVWLGDASAPHTDMSVWANGAEGVSNVSTAPGQFIQQSFTVKVYEQLDLHINASGSNPQFALDAVSITHVVNPLAVSAGADQTVNEGTQVSFAGSAHGGTGAQSYAWAFGDGSSASGTLTPTHIYTTFGKYTATLTVTDANGQRVQDRSIITVNNVAPKAKVGGPYAGAAGTAIAFVGSATDAGSTDTLTYAWSFGDGTTSSLQNPHHKYATAGVYSVTFTVTDNGGASTSAATTATVTSIGLPTANAGSNQTVNEGAMVTFNGSAAGSSALSYVWTFGDGSSEPGTLMPMHTYAAPGSYTATLTVTDAVGQTATSSIVVTVKNLPPTAMPGGPYTGIPGAAITFAGSATDPGSGDTFTYLWNFGDGTTSALQSPSHAYAGTGSYTATLTVRDQSGASASASTVVTVTAGTSGSVIQTAFDTIPNFGAHPTIISVASGNWSDPQTWSLGRLPTTGDIVDIEPGTTVTYDVMSSDQLNTVEILAGGQLHWRPDVNTEIVVGNFIVLPGGDLEVGTVAAPIAPNVMANIIIADQAINTAIDPNQFGTGLIGLGTVHMAGAAKTPFITLAAEPHAGDTSLSLSQAPVGWEVGDQLFLPDTQQYYTNPGNGMVPQWEMVNIAAISGTTVRLTSPLHFNHLGARDADGTLHFLPDAVNMSRNIMIASQNPDGTRGYVMFTGRADVDIRYVGFCEMGRTTVSPLDNTTYDTTGQVTHIGTNQADRYPMYFRHLDGPAQTPADGYQFTAIGNEIDNGGSAAPLQKWGLVVHDSNYGLISGNVIQNVGGAAFVTQDGSESYNVFDGNFAAVVSAPGKSDESDLAKGGNPGRDGAGFWFRGHNNYVRNNVAVDSALGFQYMSYRRGNISVPLFAGADSSNATQMQIVNLATLPILQFQGNEAYGAMGRGLDIWEIGSLGEVLYAVPDSTIKDFSAWNFYTAGISIYRTHCIVFDGIVLRGDVAKDGHSIGFNLASPYRLRDHTIINSDVQGLATGVIIDMSVVGGMQTGSIAGVSLAQTMSGELKIAKSFFACYTGIAIKTDRLASAQSAPRSILIDNVRFANVNYTIPGVAQQFIAMVYTPTRDMTAGANLLESDQVQVANFNGVSGDNFNVYYLQQAPNFVIPTTDSTQGVLGSPVANLTNQQAWAQYGIAIAGGLAPTTKTRAGILGFVEQI
jgi:PKD repeat protein